MRIVLNSEIWEINTSTSLSVDDNGRTDFSTRTIDIHSHLHPKCRLETLIHEMIHASFDWLAEDFVEIIAEDIARVLYDKFRYRCPKSKTIAD